MDIKATVARQHLTIRAEVHRADDNDKKMTLRLPEKLHGALVRISQKERRSLHAQIITILEEDAKKRGDYKDDGDE